MVTRKQFTKKKATAKASTKVLKKVTKKPTKTSATKVAKKTTKRSPTKVVKKTTKRSPTKAVKKPTKAGSTKAAKNTTKRSPIKAVKKLRVILTGATGMVGSGVLQACLEHDNVEQVLSVSRKSCGVKHKKLKEVIHRDFLDWSKVKSQFKGYNACFFCLGGTSYRVSEADYRKFTVDMPVSLAKNLSKGAKNITFCYISGAGTNRKGPVMWQRVKGEAEAELLKFNFKGAHMFRPGAIELLANVKPKSLIFRSLYHPLSLLFPIVRHFPNALTTNKNIGRAMIRLALRGGEEVFLDNRDINRIASSDE